MRALNRLSTRKVETAKEPGLYADGGGLYLRVADGGSKQWIFRYTVNGRNHDMGLGAVRLFTLAEARERARAAGKLRLDGIDPIAHKREQRSAAIVKAAGTKTFRQCAEEFIRDHEKTWTHPKSQLDWQRSLERFVFPKLGNLPVASIDTPLVLDVLKPIWPKIRVTASRTRGRIEAVLGYATVHHYRTGDNPARWGGHLEHALASRSDEVEHHAALPHKQAANCMAALRKDTSVAARALELIMLTAARRGEATGAVWDEIDLTAKVWTIPKARMKAGKEHKVPLSSAAIAVLKTIHEARQSQYVFPGIWPGQPIGPDALRVLFKKVAGAGMTIHGLRSTFRDWAAERTTFPRELAEKALAHQLPSAVEAAYQRSDLFEKRRDLMQAWANYCSGAATGKNILQMRR